MKRTTLLLLALALFALAACATPITVEIDGTPQSAAATSAAYPGEDSGTAYPVELTPIAGATSDATVPVDESPAAGAVVVPDLTAAVWQWVSFADPNGTTDVPDPTRYTIQFAADGQASIQADCNQVIATYTVGEDGALSIVLGPSTMAACGPESLDQIFLAALPGVTTAYSLEGDPDLYLSLAAEAGTLRFQPVGGSETTTDSTTPSLTTTTWQWTSTTMETEEIVANDPARYVAMFNADGSLNLQADCNIVNGTYTAGDDGSMTVTLGASTMAMCPADSQASLFTAGIGAATGYAVAGDTLTLTLGEGAGTMTFTAAPVAEQPQIPAAPALTSATWEWIGTTTPVEQVTASDPARYTVTFNADGTLAVKADCNNVTGTYVDNGGQLTITLGASTMAMCPPDTQDQLFTQSLSAAAGYFFEGEDLLIDMMADAGTMRFRPAAAAAQEGGKPQPGAPEPGAPEAAGGITGAWQWSALVQGDRGTPVADPARYVVTFNPDGTLTFQADCNTGAGSYTAGADGTLSIALGPTTLVACAPGSLDQIFLGGLSAASAYQMESGNLLIVLANENGTMAFVPQP